MELVLLGKYTVFQPAEKLFSFYGTERFIIVFRTGVEITLPRMKWIESTPSRRFPLRSFQELSRSGREKRILSLLHLFVRPYICP